MNWLLVHIFVFLSKFRYNDLVMIQLRRDKIQRPLLPVHISSRHPPKNEIYMYQITISRKNISFLTFSVKLKLIIFISRKNNSLILFFRQICILKNKSSNTHACCFLLICNSCKSLSLDTSDTCRPGWCIVVFGEDTVESIKDLSPALAILWLLDNVLLWPGRKKE